MLIKNKIRETEDKNRDVKRLKEGKARKRRKGNYFRYSVRKIGARGREKHERDFMSDFEKKRGK